jgi:hypothetical protein
MHAAEATSLQIDFQPETVSIEPGGSLHLMRKKFKAALAAVEGYGRL